MRVRVHSMMYGGAPLLDPADMQANALERMLSAAGAKPLYHLSDASGCASPSGVAHMRGSRWRRRRALDMQTKMQLQPPPQHIAVACGCIAFFNRAGSQPGSVRKSQSRRLRTVQRQFD